MAKIQKGMAATTAVIGVLCILFGIGTSICAWILNGKISNEFVVSGSSASTSNITFGSYWWGGITFIVPGILGVIAGCTRNVVVMVFFLIFNLVCLISALAVSVLAAMIIVVWSVVNNMLQDGDCITKNTGFTTSCVCANIYRETYTITGATCDQVKGIQVILGAMVAMAAISSLLAFIASYISCCSLCNQEHENHGTIIIQPGVGAYQPTPMVVSHTNVHTSVPPPYYNQQQQNFNQQQPQYNPQQSYYPQQQQAQQQPAYDQPPQYLQGYDKAKLVENQVI